MTYNLEKFRQNPNLLQIKLLSIVTTFVSKRNHEIYLKFSIFFRLSLFLAFIFYFCCCCCFFINFLARNSDFQTSDSYFS